MNPLFIDIDDTLIQVDEIKYARMQREPGLPSMNETPDVLVVWFKRGGHVVLPNTTKQELVEVMVSASIRGLPD